MVPLPCSLEELLRPDAVVVTHSHFDHFDSAAITRLPRDVPPVCQPSDCGRFRNLGFSRVIPMGASPVDVDQVRFFRTHGRHGRRLIGRAIGPASGFVVAANGEPSLYVAGDTVWGPAVLAALERHRSDVVVLSAGAARFNIGFPHHDGPQ